jgi:hypothetical protein
VLDSSLSHNLQLFYLLADSMIGAALLIANQAAALKAKHTLTQRGDDI